jgi:hypothetical protein
MSKTQLVLDVTERVCHFSFAPNVRVELSGVYKFELQLRTVQVEGSSVGQVAVGVLTPLRRRVLLELIEQ